MHILMTIQCVGLSYQLCEAYLLILLMTFCNNYHFCINAKSDIMWTVLTRFIYRCLDLSMMITTSVIGNEIVSHVIRNMIVDILKSSGEEITHTIDQVLV